MRPHLRAVPSSNGCSAVEGGQTQARLGQVDSAKLERHLWPLQEVLDDF